MKWAILLCKLTVHWLHSYRCCASDKITDTRTLFKSYSRQAVNSLCETIIYLNFIVITHVSTVLCSVMWQILTLFFVENHCIFSNWSPTLVVLLLCINKCWSRLYLWPIYEKPGYAAQRQKRYENSSRRKEIFCSVIVRINYFCSMSYNKRSKTLKTGENFSDWICGFLFFKRNAPGIVSDTFHLNRSHLLVLGNLAIFIISTTLHNVWHNNMLYSYWTA